MTKQRADAPAAEVDLEAEQERETQELMSAPAHPPVRGALRQVRHPQAAWSGKRPAWCEGCAWQTKAEGGCVVFVSCEDPWLVNGVCEAWADEEVRAEIERAIAEYGACRGADSE